MQSLIFNDDAIGTTNANDMSPLSASMKSEDDDELFKSLKLVRHKMTIGSHKYSISGNNDFSCTSTTFMEVTNIVSLPSLDDDVQSEERSSSPVPTRYDAQFTVPPLRPHNDSWLQDDVPSFLEAGPEFIKDDVKENDDSLPSKGKSSKSTETKPSQKQLAQAFETLSQRTMSTTRRVYTREDLYVPFMVEPVQQHEVQLSSKTGTGKSVPPVFEALARAASISPHSSPKFQKRSKYAQTA